MDFLSGIGNFFGNLGHSIFGGGNNSQVVTTTTTQVNPMRPQNPANGNSAQNSPNPQPQQSNNALNLFQSPPQKIQSAPQAPASAAIGNFGQLQKAVTPQPAPQPNSNGENGNPVLNKVGDFISTAVQPLVKFGQMALETPHAIYREIQNKPINDIQQNIFHTNDPGEIAKQIVGDTAATALTAAAPGISNVAEATAAKVLPEALSPIVQKVIPQAAAGAITGGGYNASDALAHNDSAGDIAKSALTGAAVGGAGGALFGGLPLLRKAVPGEAEAAAVAPASAEEVAPGLRSVNPTQAEDAAQQTAQQAAATQPPVAAVTPAERDIAVASRVEPPAPVPAVPAAPPTVADLAVGARPQNELQTAIEQAHNAGDDAKVSQLITQLPPDMQQPMRSALGIPEPQSVVPSAAPDTQIPPVAPSTAPELPPTAQLPEMPANAAEATQPIAPQTHDALVKQLGAAAQDLKGQYGTKAPINLDDLKARAQGVIQNMSDENLLKAYSTIGPDTMIRDSDSFALARAALDRLGKNADDPAAVQTVSNILDAIDRYTSKSGEGLRIAQEEFDTMPLPMKVRYIVKKIDAANAGEKNYASLADDPQKAEIVESTITNFLKSSDVINQRVAATEGQLQELADQALKGQRSNVNPQPLIQALKNDQRALSANNGELVKYYQSLTPSRSLGQKTNDFARTMMLGSFTGRVNDLLTTAGNVFHQGLQNVTQGLLAKAVNIFKPGAAVDTLRGGRQFAQGAAEGVKQGVGEFKGVRYTGDVQKALRSDTALRSGLPKAQGPIGRTVSAATEFATNASKGVTDQRLYQLAVREGQQAGLKGDLLNQYATARAAVPSRAMQEAADQLHLQVNNLNDNPVTHTLNRVAAAISADKPGVGGTIAGMVKNQIMPFTSWLGGNIYNSIMDKNVVAAFTKTLVSAGKGDLNGVVENLAKTANNAAYAYGLGYLMTQAGLVTNQDAQGYNDAGAYFHIGDRYIPVGFLGFFAPNIILGNAAYNGLQSHQGDPAGAIARAASDSLMNFGRSVNITGALGQNNTLARNLTSASQQGSGLSAGDVAAQTAGSVAGQFVPAISGDANAVVNNSSLNPAHEAANTAVQELNPKTGNMVKDPTASALASFENRIPVVSQGLPRKAGVAAPDLVDRVTRGNRDTSTTIQKAQDAKDAAAIDAKDKAADIPNPSGTYSKGDSFDGAVQARVERGEYDKAISAYQQQIDIYNKDSNIPKSKITAVQDKIKTLQATKGFDPSVMDLYKNTSLSEWRNMGDPKSDAYDPDKYALLWKYDNSLTSAKVSGNASDNTIGKYSPKAPPKGRSGSGSSKASGNTISSPTQLKDVSFGKLAPQKISVAIPQVGQLKPNELVKKRTISVGKAA